MSLLQNIQNWLQGQGFRSDQAAGITAGIYAESRGDATAVNPTSGAFGIGQWLGSRKRTLIARYGANPTLGQQLSFLVWELRGGDYGGAAVLNAQGADNVLSNYITRFMRPADGGETTGDIARGRSYLYSTNQINIGGGSGWQSGAANNSTVVVPAPGRQWLLDNIPFGMGGPIADALSGLGTGLKAPGEALDNVPVIGDIKDMAGNVIEGKPIIDFDSWFTRIALIVFALIFIAAALFTFKGADAIAIVQKVGKAS